MNENINEICVGIRIMRNKSFFIFVFKQQHYRAQSEKANGRNWTSTSNLSATNEKEARKSKEF